MLLGVLVAGMALLMHVGEAVPPDTLVPGYWALPILVAALRSLRAHGVRGYFSLALSAMALLALVVVTGAGWEPTRVRMSDLVWLLQPLAEVLLFGDAVIRMSRARDRTLRRQQEASIRQAEQAAEAQARREAVVRHSRAQYCTVRLVHHDGTLAVEVVDDGNGFDPARRPPGRLGMRRSIIQRMDDRGGQAHTTSAPGQGTSVVLNWPAPEQAHPSRWRAAPDELMRRLFTPTALPGLLAALVTTVIMGPLLARPVLGIASALVVLGVGFYYAWRLMRRPLRRRSVAVLSVVAVVGFGINLLTAPDVVSTDYLLWMAWGSSALIHLVVQASSTRVGSLAVAGWTGVQVLLMAVLFTPADAWRLSALVTAGAGECVITLLALPLIESVATGRREPLDHDVRTAAQDMEIALHDELVLGPAHGDLISELARARAEGWQLTSMLSPDDPAGALQQARNLLALLGPPRRPGQPVMLSSHSGRTTAVVLAPTPQQEAAWQRRLDRIGGTAELDPAFARLRLPVA